MLIAHRGMSIGMIYRCKQVHYVFVLPRHSVDRILCVMINRERFNMVNTEVILLVYLRLNTCVHRGTLVWRGVLRSTLDLIKRLDKMDTRWTMDSQGHPIQGLTYEKTMSMKEAHIASVVKSDVVFGKYLDETAIF